MQSKGKQNKPIELVRKPILTGSWNGKDAKKLALKRMLAVLGISALYVLAGAMLNFDAFWLRVLVAVMIVGLIAYYQYASGMGKGENDASYGEILYDRAQSGKEVTEADRDRSFHKLKGLFASLLGCVPFFLIALVFAFLAQKTTYQLGVLPSWTQELMRRTEFSAGLSYYNAPQAMTVVDVLRVIVRAMVLPFINIASAKGSDAVLLVERLSPLLVLIAPLGYGLGYMQGLNARARINTGIRMGDDKKKRRERKARKQRQRSKTPERLI